MESDPTRVRALLVSLPVVTIIAIHAGLVGPLRIHVETIDRTVFCEGCASRAWIKDRRPGRARRSGLFRASDTAGVAQAPVAVPPVVVPGRQLD